MAPFLWWGWRGSTASEGVETRRVVSDAAHGLANDEVDHERDGYFIGDMKDCVCTLVFTTSSGKILVQVTTPAIPPANRTFAAASFGGSSSLLCKTRLQIS